MAWTPRTWIVGETVSAAQLNAEIRDQFNARVMTEVQQGTDQALPNNTTTLTDSSLTFSATANARYWYRLMASFRADTAADGKFAWTVPSGGAMSRYQWGLAAAGSGTAEGWSSVAMQLPASATTAVASAAIGTSTSAAYHEEGIIAISSTAGSVTFQFAQNTGHASAIELRAVSKLLYQRIA